MSSDIYAKPDLSRKTTNNKNVGVLEEEATWVEREASIYQSAGDIGSEQNACKSQRRDFLFQLHSQRPATRATEAAPNDSCGVTSPGARRPPAVRGGTAMWLGVTLLLAASIILSAYSVSVTLTRDELQLENDKLRTNQSRLEQEVKGLESWIQAKRCPAGWSSFGCSCYFSSSQMLTWEKSREQCQERGADLVIIDSKDEQDFVQRLGGDRDFWIGLQNGGTDSKQQWLWVDGSPLTLSFWAPQHPIIPHLDSAALCCDANGGWRQQYLSKNKWICEK